MNLINSIYNGDCYKLIKEVPDKSVDLIYTDVPYLVIGGGGGGSFGVENRNYHNQYTDLSSEGHGQDGIKTGKGCICPGFDYSLLDELDRVMKKTNIYIWCSKAQISTIMKHYEDRGDNVDLLAMHKVDPIPTCNNKYLSDLEYCVFARAPGTPLGGTYHTKSKCYSTRCNKDDKAKYQHSTVKPLEMVKNHLINSSKPGDLILDPFLGSGTSAAAAKELGRRYLGFEIDPHWFKVAKDRLEGWDQNGTMDLFMFEGEERNEDDNT